MSARFVTFSSDQHQSISAVEALGSVGFVFGDPQPVTRTLLDSFDGRLHATGLRVVVRESDRLQLIVMGDDSVAVQLSIADVPTRVAELPAGPVRSRLADIVDVRALQPIIAVSSTCTSATCRDRAGKVVAAAEVHERVRVRRGDQTHTDSAVQWTVDIEELTGYAKHAERARDALDQIGLARFDGDSMTLIATDAGIDLAGFNASPTVPLDPSMPALDGFRAVLANLADTMMANWQGTIEQIDPEYLHDLRVAIRRTRTVLAQGKKVLPTDVAHRADEQFSWLGALTGPARDLDVYLIEWSDYTQALDGDTVVALEPVRALLERRRDAAVVALLEGLRSRRADEAMSWWSSWLAVPVDVSAHDDHPPARDSARALGRVVARRIEREHRKLIDDGRRITDDTPAEEVHDLRKQAKKLRYVFDCFGSLVAKGHRKKFVTRLKTLQDILGEHQDAEVHATELSSISDELSQRDPAPETLLAIGRLDQWLAERRATTRAQFDQRFSQYDTEATERALAAVLDDVDA